MRDNAARLADENRLEIQEVIHLIARYRAAIIADLAATLRISPDSIPKIAERFESARHGRGKRQ